MKTIYRLDPVIGHVRYIKTLTWLRDSPDKIAKLLSFLCVSIPKGDLDVKKAPPNKKVCPESFGARILIYWKWPVDFAQDSDLLSTVYFEIIGCSFKLNWRSGENATSPYCPLFIAHGIKWKGLSKYQDILTFQWPLWSCVWLSCP